MSGAHQLIRLRGEVLNKPQLMNIVEFNDITNYLNDRNSTLEAFKVVDTKLDGSSEDSKYPSYVSVNEDTKTAIIDFNGALTYKPMFSFATCGYGLSYQTLKTVFQDLLESDVTNISMVVNSGGGQAYACFDSANYVRQLLNDYNGSLSVLVDGVAFSAAYAWIAIADEIVMTRDAQAGSIGVVIELYNDNKALEKEGYSRTFVYSGSAKIPFDKDGEFTEEFITGLQASCDELYEEFISHVSLHRDIDKELVRGTQANTFSSKESIELGLADEVMTFEEYMNHLASKSPTKEAQTLSKSYLDRFLNKSKEVDINMSEVSELQAQMSALTVEKESLLSQVAAMNAEKESMVAQLAEFQCLVAEREASEALAKEALLKAEQEASEKALALRKEQLGAVLAADQVEAQLEAFSGLNDTQFAGVIATFASMKSTAVAAPLMQELGDEGTSLEVEQLSEHQKLEAETRKYLA